MRGIPSLQTLCLRSVGGKGCNSEDVFCPGEDGSPSMASRLLRSFQVRTRRTVTDSDDQNDKESMQVDDANTSSKDTWSKLPLSRIPSIGKGSARREQASDVDLNHPWIAVVEDDTTTTTSTSQRTLVGAYNTPALDLLQSYVDALVELSRMDDSRLGLHFFQEWKANVQVKGPGGLQDIDPPISRRNISKENDPSLEDRPTKRVKRSLSPQPPQQSKSKLNPKDPPPPLGSLSLHNTVLHLDTIEAMVESGMTRHLGVLDLTGIQPLNDDMLRDILQGAPYLQRLSLKNCRRITSQSLDTISESSTKLKALDVGGSYNLEPSRILETVAALSKLNELHASGFPWDDDLLLDLTSLRSWKALSWGYLLPRKVTQAGLKQALSSQSASLTSLALPFCEHLVDAALLGNLGRHLPKLQVLDLRGNGGLNSLTGWYDGRATLSPPPPPQSMLVLGRYSGLSKANIEDTKRYHPIQAVDLVCHLDSGGVGEGIRRVQS